MVDAEKLEGAILQRLKKLDASPGLLEASLKTHQQSIASNAPALEAEKAAYESELRQVEQKIAGLVDRIAELPKDVSELLIARLKEHQSRKQQLADNLLRLSVELDSVYRETWNPEEIREAIRFVNQNLDGLSPLVRRDLIRLLVSKVEFGRTTMKVALNAGGLLAVKSAPSGVFSGDLKNLEKGALPLWPRVTSLCQLSGLGWQAGGYSNPRPLPESLPSSHRYH